MKSIAWTISWFGRRLASIYLLCRFKNTHTRESFYFLFCFWCVRTQTFICIHPHRYRYYICVSVSVLYFHFYIYYEYVPTTTRCDLAFSRFKNLRTIFVGASFSFLDFFYYIFIVINEWVLSNTWPKYRIITRTYTHTHTLMCIYISRSVLYTMYL